MDDCVTLYIIENVNAGTLKMNRPSGFWAGSKSLQYPCSEA